LREEEAVEGGFTIYGKYMLVLECIDSDLVAAPASEKIR
jgi:hypothetical protein